MDKVHGGKMDVTERFIARTMFSAPVKGGGVRYFQLMSMRVPQEGDEEGRWSMLTRAREVTAAGAPVSPVGVVEVTTPGFYVDMFQQGEMKIHCGLCEQVRTSGRLEVLSYI